MLISLVLCESYQFLVLNAINDTLWDVLQECMNETNCLAAMTLADSHAHRPMYEFAKKFACQHFTTIVDDDDFLRLPADCIIDLLSDRRLNCKAEEEVSRRKYLSCVCCV